MSDLSFVAGDSAPSVSGVLTNTDGTPFDLTNATVRFQMRLLTAGAFQIDAAASVVGSPTAGTVRYDFVAGDLVAGDYESRWQITFTGGTVEHTLPANTITVEAE